MDAQNYKKNCVDKFLNLVKFWKCVKKYILNPRTFLLLFYIVQKEDAHRRATKVEIEDSRSALKAL